MPTKPGKVTVKDKGMEAAMKRQRALHGHKATIGVHRGEGAHEGGITNARLAAVHEFGANIDHPGGTPFTVDFSSAGRGGAMVGGAVRFLPKGSPDAIGVTQPHRIRIPERSFLRSAFDMNRKRYEDILEVETGKVIDGTQTPKGAVATVGEFALADVVDRINTGIPPKLAASTRARKGGTKQLIHTGQLKQSITVKVSRRK